MRSRSRRHPRKRTRPARPSRPARGPSWARAPDRRGGPADPQLGAELPRQGLAGDEAVEIEPEGQDREPFRTTDPQAEELLAHGLADGQQAVGAAGPRPPAPPEGPGPGPGGRTPGARAAG